MTTVVTFHGDDSVEPSDGLVYEAEWNEGATRAEHEDAVLYFAGIMGTDVLLQVSAALLAGADPSVGYVTATERRPCWNCSGSGVRCCEFGADREVPS